MCNADRWHRGEGRVDRLRLWGPLDSAFGSSPGSSASSSPLHQRQGHLGEGRPSSLKQAWRIEVRVRWTTWIWRAAAADEKRRRESWRPTLLLAYQSLGVVYDDVTTLPLYVHKSAFAGNDIQHSVGNEEIYGVLSFVFWTLTLITLFKYVLIVLRADDGGEGGTFALYSLICRHVRAGLLPGGGTRDELLEEDKTRGRHGERPVSRVRAVLEKYRVLQRLLLLFALLGTCMVIDRRWHAHTCSLRVLCCITA